MYAAIVVGTDGSERADRAVDAAAELAEATGAALHVVCAFTPQVVGAAAAMTVVAPIADAEAAAKAVTGAVLARTRSSRVAVTTHEVCASAVDALCLVAEAVAADVIVVGNRGMHGRARLLGSVPSAVSHRAPCSVLVVQTDQRAA